MFLSGLRGMRHAVCSTARNAKEKSGELGANPKLCHFIIFRLLKGSAQQDAWCSIMQKPQCHKVDSGATTESLTRLPLTSAGKRNRKPVKATGKTVQLKACTGTGRRWVVSESWHSARRFRERKGIFHRLCKALQPFQCL